MKTDINRSNFSKTGLENNQHQGLRSLKYWAWLMLALVFFFGLVGRFYDFDDPPLDFHPTRQLHSMLIARGMYYENLEGAPDEHRQLAVLQWKSEGQIEPPIMERLSAWGYRLVGTDDLRVPRFLAIFFWTAGAIGLFFLMRDVVGIYGAVIGLAYFMVLPFPLYASRSFQPEPLMTAGIIFSWWAMVRWFRHRNWVNTILVGLLSGFAIYVKLPAIFFVAPALLVLVLIEDPAGKRCNLLESITHPQVITMAILAILPALIYHVDGLYVSGFLQRQTSFRFFPSLVADPFHYLRWKDVIDQTLGIEFFLFGLAGVLLIKEKTYRVLFFSVFVGYLLYGITFNYHITTHSYYQIPLTPSIAIGLAAFGGVLFEHFQGHRTFLMIVVGGLLFFWMSFNFWDARMTLKHADFRDQPEFYAQLGSKLQDYSVVSITPNYGYHLAYWGWKQTTNWSSVGDFIMRELAGMEHDREAMFASAIEGRQLFLVTNFAEFNRQQDIQEFLYETYPIYDQGEGFIIFDLRGK